MSVSPEPFDIVVLISGRGSNLGSLIAHAGRYRIRAVVSNNPDAAGLVRAKEAGIETFAFSRAEYPSVASLKEALFQKVRALSPQLIALAGFMLLVPREITEEFEGRLVNIHPSLLPKFPGLDTHARALMANERTHGCSVHFVDGGVDTGPLIAQAPCLVEQDDTAETLGARVLAREHALYPWVIERIACGEIALSGARVQTSEPVRIAARELGFVLPPSP